VTADLKSQYALNGWNITAAAKAQEHKPSMDFPGRDVNLATSIIRTAYWRPFCRCVHRRVSLHDPLNNANRSIY